MCHEVRSFNRSFTKSEFLNSIEKKETRSVNRKEEDHAFLMDESVVLEEYEADIVE